MPKTIAELDTEENQQRLPMSFSPPAVPPRIHAWILEVSRHLPSHRTDYNLAPPLNQLEERAHRCSLLLLVRQQLQLRQKLHQG